MVKENNRDDGDLKLSPKIIGIASLLKNEPSTSHRSENWPSPRSNTHILCNVAFLWYNMQILYNVAPGGIMLYRLVNTTHTYCAMLPQVVQHIDIVQLPLVVNKTLICCAMYNVRYRFIPASQYRVAKVAQARILPNLKICRNFCIVETKTGTQRKTWKPSNFSHPVTIFLFGVQ